MKKRKICRLIKRMIKNFILVVITIFAFLMFLASTGALVTESPKALIVFVLSAAWIFTNDGFSAVCEKYDGRM